MYKSLITLLLICSLIATSRQTAAAEKPRLMVLTDIGGDPDDQQSLIRLMLYVNEFEIEGLIATASGTPGELKETVTRPDLIREIVEAYGNVRANLARHAAGYPEADALLKRVKSGNPHRGLTFIGQNHDTEGSRCIVDAVDPDNKRPLNIVIWGGQTDFAQALWRVKKDRGPGDLERFISRIRIYDIGDQDGIQPWIFENFPDLFYVLAKSAPGTDMRTGAYRGMYLGGDESLTSRQWIDTHVRKDHGPLGALYPTQTWTAPNPHSTLKEGDTPSWFYFLPTGLGDPAHPDWGSWGGRFQLSNPDPRAGGLWRDARDTVGKTTDARATVWRWRPAFQADFQARMDWCVKPYREANHPPTVVLNGKQGTAAVEVSAAAGSPLQLSAVGSADPDGGVLSYHWFVYPEPGNHHATVSLADDDGATITWTPPNDATGQSVHFILQVSDNGSPPLVRYRRAIVRVTGDN